MTDAPEFSARIPVDRVPMNGMRERVEADADAREALAVRFGAHAIESLVGDFTIRLLAGGPMVHVSGTVSARLTRACVVSAAPVPEALEIDVDVDFAPPGMIEENVELTLSDADPPEALDGDSIDLGELAAQQMALAMDPYPRAPDADLASVIETLPEGRKAAIDATPTPGPFSGLASLRKPEEGA